MEFKETHLKAVYKLLKHEGHTSRVGSLDYTTNKYENEFVNSEKEFLDYARKWNGKRNVFIGRNPRNKDGTVNGSYCISFDIDPIRPKGEASTNEQHSNALNAGRRILESYSGGYLSSSGNGCLLLYAVPSGIPDLELHYRKEAVFIKELNEMCKGLGVRIDATCYSEAVIKGIGTMSTKGELPLHRCSGFIDYPIPPYRNCSKLLLRLNEINVEEQKTDIVSLPPIHNGDRSVADFHLVNFLKKNGAGPAAALAALKSSPYGRQTDEKDQARLISKIYKESMGKTGTEKNYFTSLFEPNSKDGKAITTGIGSLDIALGPLPKGEITTIAARSGFGKSSFACTVSEYLRKRSKKVLYFSTEMQEQYIMHKLVGISCGIPLTHLLEKTFSEEEAKRIRQYEQELLLSSIKIVDDFQPKIEQVRNKVLEYRPDLIVFDHITQVGTHWEYVAQFMRDLKALTAEEKCVTLVLSQLNEPGRGKDGNEAVSIRGDVRGSQEVIFLSAIFCFISNPYPVKTNVQPVSLTIAKNRYGISGIDVSINVDKATGRYSE